MLPQMRQAPLPDRNRPGVLAHAVLRHAECDLIHGLVRSQLDARWASATVSLGCSCQLPLSPADTLSCSTVKPVFRECERRPAQANGDGEVVNRLFLASEIKESMTAVVVGLGVVRIVLSRAVYRSSNVAGDSVQSSISPAKSGPKSS